jgi:hypothetical protein
VTIPPSKAPPDPTGPILFLLMFLGCFCFITAPPASAAPKLLSSTPRVFVVESIQRGPSGGLVVRNTGTGLAYEARYCKAMQPGMNVTLDEEVWEYPDGSKPLSVGGVEKACMALTPPRYPSS